MFSGIMTNIEKLSGGVLVANDNFFTPLYYDNNNETSVANDNKKRTKIEILEDRLNDLIELNSQGGILRYNAIKLYDELMKSSDSKLISQAKKLDEWFFITENSYKREMDHIIKKEISKKTNKEEHRINRFDIMRYQISRNKNLEFIAYNSISVGIITTGFFIYTLFR